jgi:hypothetical protein
VKTSARVPPIPKSAFEKIRLEKLARKNFAQISAHGK